MTASARGCRRKCGEPFDALLEDKSAMLLLEMEESFIDGFRIGARLMLEVFYNVAAAPGTEDEE